MSDGYSDTLEYYHFLFNSFLAALSDYHKFQFHESAKSKESYIFGLRMLQKQFGFLTNNFLCSELKLTKDQALLIMDFRDNFSLPTLEQTMYLLLCQARLFDLAGLQHSSPYHDKLLIFIGENGQIMPNGVQYQNSLWKLMDGDQDILLGIAKKRCHSKPFAGQPVILVAEKHRYRKSCFVLKEVVRIFP